MNESLVERPGARPAEGSRPVEAPRRAEPRGGGTARRAWSTGRPARLRAATPALLLALLLALHAALAWSARSPGLLTRQDDARYLVLARALLGGTYRDVLWPGAPWHHMYPPGYPALVALWVALGGEGFGWLVVLQIALSLAAIALVVDAARRALGPVAATGALVALAANSHLIEWAGQIASEGALALSVALAVWAAALPPGRRQLAVLLAAAVAAPYMRTAGVVVPAALVLDLASRRRFRDAAIAAGVCAVTVGPLLLWTAADPAPVAGSSYTGDLAQGASGSGHGAAPGMLALLAGRAVSNAGYYLTNGIPWTLDMPSVAGTSVDNVLGVLALGAALAVGLARSWRRLRLAALVLLATAALLLVWPYQVDRYLVPFVPVLAIVAFDGFATLGGRVGGWWAARRGARDTAAPGRAGALLAGGAALLLATGGLARTGGRLAEVRGCDRGGDIPPAECVTPDQASFFRAALYVRDSLPGDARVLSAKSEPLHVYARRTTLPLSLWIGRDSAAFWDGLRQNRVQYVLLGALQFKEREEPDGLARRLAARCASLDLVAAFPPRTYLFRVADGPRSAAAAGGRGGACAALDAYLRTPGL